ncbi:SCP2 sterol-binding domain-containing protein [Micromonospora sp. 4G57]|uniref:SCP2 sterol-binding domain-containing protein n=1 Tax=Micromonospora sicca TaxID=2202420 RepID=A0ABU5JMG1_9ACTN|nr:MULTISPECIES: SCP2 sterol-binding domain-containing protein [unclassified Micromonospora]MDZ5441392.1 SCP2 sterol-binding domain-containing protein [Micromonospora sp. 4G57]MDZ5493825.1 SCP2 sterol-binding domain-containing protein [Micromonospora sp. 4G53]
MGEVIEQFFASLPARAPAVLRSPIAGTLRIDLTTGNRTDHWLIELAPGSVRVRHEHGPADAVWTSSAGLFERLVTGRAQGIASVLRNECTFSGQVLLFLAFRRFFPDPPGTRDPRQTAREQAGRPA